MKRTWETTVFAYIHRQMWRKTINKIEVEKKLNQLSYEFLISLNVAKYFDVIET